MYHKQYADARVGMSGIRHWNTPKVNPLELHLAEQTVTAPDALPYPGNPATYAAVNMTAEDIEGYLFSLRNGTPQRMTAAEISGVGELDKLLLPDQVLGHDTPDLGNLDSGVESGSKSPSEIARSWQGSGKYPGIDDYVDVTVKKGTILYRGEPNGTGYFTTLDAIEQSGRDAAKVFEGLQVEKNPIHGYRGEMQGYLFNDDVASAYGITNANPQFGKGGLPQYYVPYAQDLIDKGILTPVDSIKLYK